MSLTYLVAAADRNGTTALMLAADDGHRSAAADSTGQKAVALAAQNVCALLERCCGSSFSVN